jgi:hypothetical protein
MNYFAQCKAVMRRQIPGDASDCFSIYSGSSADYVKVVLVSEIEEKDVSGWLVIKVVNIP